MRALFLSGSTLLLTLAFLSACSTTASRHADGEAVGERAAHYALSMQGKPYRYGGHTPQGFDCSGLVSYSYAQAGVKLPRSTEGLRGNSTSVSQRQLRPGDLLFFTQEGKRSSHVGLYLGDERFVHAPSTGKNVAVASMNDPYWRRHFEGARRPRID